MKYAIIIPDGCADEPQESLGGKTPLEAARVPAMDAVAAAGVVGRANHVPALAAARLRRGQPEPAWATTRCEHFTGRAPLEAAAQGIALGPDDWAIRCNLVTVEDQVMRDFTAGHISTAEAAAADRRRPGAARLATRIEFYPRRELPQPADLPRRPAAAPRSPATRGPRRRTT